jgi:hypothetical protein
MTDRPTSDSLTDFERAQGRGDTITEPRPTPVRIPEWRRRALEDHARRGFVAVKVIR